MSYLKFIFVVFVAIGSSNSFNIPSIAIPSIDTIFPTVKPGASFLEMASAYASGVSNAACEVNPTGLLCGTSVALGHKILQNIPAGLTIRPCSVFLASPHCCAQFCTTGGSCSANGACICNPTGPPKVCQMLMNSDSYTTPGMNGNDLAVLDICRGKCANSTNGCTKAAAATDGIVGTVCFCYC